jgi:hypothetical protein
VEQLAGNKTYQPNPTSTSLIKSTNCALLFCRADDLCTVIAVVVVVVVVIVRLTTDLNHEYMILFGCPFLYCTLNQKLNQWK